MDGWSEGKTRSLEREMGQYGGKAAAQTGLGERGQERDRDLNVSLLDTQKPDCAADEKEGRRKVTKPRMNVASALS